MYKNRHYVCICYQVVISSLSCIDQKPYKNAPDKNAESPRFVANGDTRKITTQARIQCEEERVGDADENETDRKEKNQKKGG
jgi:hypothetical protein